MPLVIKEIPTDKAMFLVPLLLETEEGEERVRARVRDATSTMYASWLDGQLVGAAIVRWEEDKPSEIVYVVVPYDLHGKGYGTQIIRFLQAELRRRGGHTLLAGTTNASLGNIVFYQKCDFRMFEVRRDYFAYIQPPIDEYGIVLYDMLVFRYDAE